MWYEALPSAGILFGCICGAMVLPPIVNWVLNPNRKHPVRYWHADPHDYQMYIRDAYKFGSVYKPQGLEALDNLKAE